MSPFRWYSEGREWWQWDSRGDQWLRRSYSGEPRLQYREFNGEWKDVPKVSFMEPAGPEPQA